MPTSINRLASVLDQFADAEENLKERRRELKAAQDRADAMSGLTEAAEREFKNADARYRVASGKKEADTLGRSLTGQDVQTMREVFSRMKAMKDRSTAVEAAVAAARECDTNIDAVVAILGPIVGELERAPTTGARNGAPPVLAQSDVLMENRDKLKQCLQGVSAEPEDVFDVPGLTELVRKITGQSEHGGDESEGPRIQELWEKREKARSARRNAPATERAARDDVVAKQAALDLAQRLLDEARAARDEASQGIIERIQVGPEENGEIELTAIFVEGFDPVKNNVTVRWTLEAGELTEPEGTRVHVLTRGVPYGKHKARADLVTVAYGGAAPVAYGGAAPVAYGGAAPVAYGGAAPEEPGGAAPEEPGGAAPEESGGPTATAHE
jgi:hypothetical protein